MSKLLIAHPETTAFSLADIFQSLSDGDNRVVSVIELSELAYAAKQTGDLESALEYETQAFEFSLELSDTLDERNYQLLLSAKLFNLGQLHYNLNKPTQARRCFEKARSIDTSISNPIGEAASLRGLAFLEQDDGHLADAVELHKLSLLLNSKANYQEGIALDQANLGDIYLELGDSQQAKHYLEQALQNLREANLDSYALKAEQLLRQAINTLEWND